MSARKRSLRRWAVIAPVIVAVALVAAVGRYLWQIKSFAPGAESYHYDVGVRFDHSAAAKIRLTEDGAVLTDGDKTYPLGHNPVFYAGEKRAVLTATMLAVSGDGQQGRLACFSEADFSGAGPVLRDGGREIPAEGGFLFDGGDTYLFLEEGTLVCGTESYPLTPGACVTVVYNAHFALYPYDGEKGLLSNIAEQADVTALMAGGYSVDLGKDILRSAGTELLLFTDPDLLAPAAARTSQ